MAPCSLPVSLDKIRQSDENWPFGYLLNYVPVTAVDCSENKENKIIIIIKKTVDNLMVVTSVGRFLSLYI